MKFIQLMMIVLVLSLSLAAAQDNEEVTVSPVVNARSGPGFEYTIRGSLPMGQQEGIATGRTDYPADFRCTTNYRINNKAWLRVDLGEGIEGWVNLCQVRTFGPDPLTLPVVTAAQPVLRNDARTVPVIQGEDSPVGNPALVVEVLRGGVIVRALPDLRGTPLGQVPTGHRVEMLSKLYDGSWIRILYKGVAGWVAGFMLNTSPEQLAGVPNYVAPPPPEGSFVRVEKNGDITVLLGNGTTCWVELMTVNACEANCGTASAVMVEKARVVNVCE